MKKYRPRLADALELGAIAAAVIGGTWLTAGAGFVLSTRRAVLPRSLPQQTLISFQGNLNTWQSRSPSPSPGSTRLDHFR